MRAWEIIRGIDALLGMSEDCLNMEMEAARGNEMPGNRELEIIYKAVHSHDKKHSCYYTHEDWRQESEKELREAYKLFNQKPASR